MTQAPNILDDLMTLGSSVLGNLADARHEVKAQIKMQLEHVLKRLDLVSREEFDAAFAMLAKSRRIQGELANRVAVLEASAHGHNAKKATKPVKPSLRIVKKRKRAQR